ncbi:mucin-like protein [Saccostrea echinata]|uniref:mucin-like protein n=1 Tax=Saccostrea echinata TaxID=191078 RepID=UPI002A80082B|nr:mucin-like protein [Saccostrea echinata]
MRTRLCDNPAPKNGGNPCSGADAEMKPCFKHCAVHGQWGSWSGWKLCSVTCGNGTEVYHRSCDSPAPNHGGRHCVGHSTKLVPCSASPCAIDGGWGGWSSWDTCSVTCGDGVRHRHRSCNNPSPQHGGQGCSGNKKETRNCHEQQCHPPQNGHWSDWSAWGQCSVTCHDGVQHRSRSCTNPPPSNGGHTCQGDHRESRHCNGGSCHHFKSHTARHNPVTCRHDVLMVKFDAVYVQLEADHLLMVTGEIGALGEDAVSRVVYQGTVQGPGCVITQPPKMAEIPVLELTRK